MSKTIYIVSAIVTAALITGCETSPYASRFSFCDSEAGACYRDCEDYEGEDAYYSCHAHCEEAADRCFANAYQPYQTSSYAYGQGYGPWYGRYGSWYPDSGYIISFGYLGRHGYRGPRGSHRYHGGRRPYGHGGGNRAHPQSGPHPTPQTGPQSGPQTGPRSGPQPIPPQTQPPQSQPQQNGQRGRPANRNRVRPGGQGPDRDKD